MIKVDIKLYKSQDLVPVDCDRCGKEFFRKKQYLQKSVRLKQKTYCSKDCVGVDKTKTCEECKNTFEYGNKEQRFCNSSCAASYNNKLTPPKNPLGFNGVESPKPKPIRKPVVRKVNPNCLFCGEVVSQPHNKYCSPECHKKHIRLVTNLAVAENSSDISVVLKTNRVQKNYLIETRGHACEVCGITEWQDAPAPLVLDHVNGNSDDNSLANLRLVCGNCDMQLPTYKSKNKGNGRHYRRQRYAEGKSY